MANNSFFCMDATNKDLVLECSLTTWTSYMPSMTIAIRPKMGGQVNNNNSAFIPVYLLPQLINNVANPMNHSVIQINNKNGNCTCGRTGNDFQIVTNVGTFTVTLDESQWVNLHQYLTLMHGYAPMIKEIGNCVRMHVIDLLRQVGIDTRGENGRYKTTSWYGNTNDSNSYGGGGGGGGYQGNNQRFNTPPNNSAPAPTATGMGMPGSMPAMPPMAAPGSNPTVPPAVPNMGAPMPSFTPPAAAGNPNASPATGNVANMAAGMHSMLNNAFIAPPPNPNAIPNSNG